jgi:hypothetical protein
MPMEIHFGLTKGVENMGSICVKLVSRRLWLFGLQEQQFCPMPKMSLDKKLE